MKARKNIWGKVALVSALFGGLLSFGVIALAFNGPTTNPGIGGGALLLDASNNLGFGTTNPAPTNLATGKFLTVGTTTSPGFYLRDNDAGGGRYAIYVKSTGNLAFFDDTNNAERFYIATSGDVYAVNNMYATAFVGTLTGDVSAANVSSGVFGSLQGNGAFAFPGSLGVATSSQTGLPASLSVYGGGMFTGNVSANGTIDGSQLCIGGSCRSSWSDYWVLSDPELYASSTAWKIGIGTTTPTYALTVAGEIYSTGSSTASAFCLAGTCQTTWNNLGQWTNGTGGIYYQSKVSVGTSTITYPLLVSTSSDEIFAIHRVGTTYPTLFKHGTDGAMIIKNMNTDTLALKNGNVGIGTTTPNAKFDVRNSGENIIQWGDNTITGELGLWSNGMIFGTNTSHPLYFEVGNGITGVWTTGGNLGVGTTTPDSTNYARLHVHNSQDVPGRIKITGSGSGYTSADILFQSHAGIRGVGQYYFSPLLGSGAEWFSGIPYGSLDAFAINRKTTTSFDPSVAQTNASGVSNLFYINSSGNVGIGTTSPGAKLDVSSTGSGVPLMIIRDSGTTTNQNGLGFYNANANAGSRNWAFTTNDAAYGDFNIRVSSAQGGDPFSAGSRLLTLTKAGNVGIASTTPGYALTVAGTGYFSQPIFVGTPSDSSHAATKGYVDTALTGISSSSQWTATSTGIFYNGGRVGIGELSPNYKLDVAGSINSGRVGVNGSLYLNSAVDGQGGARLIYSNVNNVLTIEQNRGIASKILLNANNGIEFQTENSTSPYNKVTRMIIKHGDTGYVGIGTTAPGRSLSIKSSSTDNGEIRLYSDTAGGHIDTISGAVAGNLYLQPASGISVFYTSGVDSYLRLTKGDGVFTGILHSNGNSYINGGNVGIGTTNPTTKLDIFKAGTATLADITQNISNNGIVISSNYLTGYYPGVMWYTTDSDSTKPKAGIWSFTDGLGSRLFLGTSGSYATGITNSALTVNWNGNIGIASTTPGYRLTVESSGGSAGYFNNPVFVGTPTSPSHAATKAYVDTAAGNLSELTVSGTSTLNGTTTVNGNWQLAGAALGNINMNGYNIVGINKLTVSTIDPVYEIAGKKYATYVSDTIGLKMEAYGKVLASPNGKGYSATLDFGRAAVGSDLWLFWHTVKEGKYMQDVVLTLSPEGTDARVWYDLRPEEKQIVIYANKSAKVSYHLVAPRHDAEAWPTILKKSEEKGVLLPLR